MNGISSLVIIRLPHGEGLELPRYETSGSAGMDLRAAIEDRMVVRPGKRVLVPTGFIFEIPDGYEGQVRPRSGLALKYGITCLNSPGTIDSDYRGEVSILLINHGDEKFIIERAMRIAQIIIAPVMRVLIEEQAMVSDTARNNNGFGSTGTH